MHTWMQEVTDRVNQASEMALGTTERLLKVAEFVNINRQRSDLLVEMIKDQQVMIDVLKERIDKLEQNQQTHD